MQRENALLQQKLEEAKVASEGGGEDEICFCFCECGVSTLYTV